MIGLCRIIYAMISMNGVSVMHDGGRTDGKGGEDCNGLGLGYGSVGAELHTRWWLGKFEAGARGVGGKDS